MTTTSTTIFRTLSKSSTAIENLSKLPGGLWALVILVVAAVVGGISCLDTLTAAVMTPQATLNLQWLRESQAADKPGRPLPVLLPPPPPPAPAPPAPAPVVVSAASPSPQKRDPAGVSATTTVRNVGHGFKKAFDVGRTAAVAPPA
ncbi:hypothetical protein N7501_000149 [Penicillium viridicatum]|nr:hypothetical protein N7501_000149 [Penicillium viridicatum]